MPYTAQAYGVARVKTRGSPVTTSVSDAAVDYKPILIQHLAKTTGREWPPGEEMQRLLERRTGIRRQTA